MFTSRIFLRSVHSDEYKGLAAMLRICAGKGHSDHFTEILFQVDRVESMPFLVDSAKQLRMTLALRGLSRRRSFLPMLP
jgi:hypothetical protein